MLKKESEVKWSKNTNNPFNLVNFSLSHASILISPDYTMDFFIFSFSSKHTLAIVLMQKKDLKT